MGAALKKNVNGLLEREMKHIKAKQDYLVRSWNPYIKGVNSYMQKVHGRELDINEKRNVAQCLQNTLVQCGLKGQNGRLFEASTTQDNIEFLGIQLPVIAALLPSLVLNKISVVQSLDRRIGAVFYLDVEHGSDKGSISRGDKMISAKTGHARDIANRRYASTMVEGESLPDSPGISGADSEAYQTTLAYAPGVILESVVIRDGSGDVVLKSNKYGDLTGDLGSGKVDINGGIEIEVGSGVDVDSGGLFVDYRYQYDMPADDYGNRTGVPKSTINMVQEPIEAMDFPLRADYSIGASIDLQKAHGINLENEIVKYLGGEVKWTIDHMGIDMMDEASRSADAANAITDWNATVGNGQAWLWHKHEIMDRFEEGNVNIIEKTLRGLATYIVCGSDVARVIKQLPNFKPVSGLGKNIMTGPQEIGNLDGRIVVQDPFLEDVVDDDGSTVIEGRKRYFMGFKVDQFLYAAFAYCPYIPLFASPTLVTSDLFAQKGFYSAAGFKVINNGLFTHGKITGSIGSS